MKNFHPKNQVTVTWLRGALSLPVKAKFEAFARAWMHETHTNTIPYLDKSVVSCFLKLGKKIVGIAQFTSPPNIIGKELGMVWIDPRFRRMGVLKKAYEVFLADQGEFYLSAPISHSMAKFLLKNMPDWQDKLHGKSLRSQLSMLATKEEQVPPFPPKKILLP